MTPKAAELVRRTIATYRPPEDLLLADWVTKNITLPEGKSVRPGPMENWPYMTEILNAMGDRGVERVTVMKSARLGYTTALMGVLAATAAMDPGPIILLMPAEDDARGDKRSSGRMRLSAGLCGLAGLMDATRSRERVSRAAEA